MSRTASPSHTRRQSSNNYGNNNQSNNHSFRSRPGGVPSSSGSGGGRMNSGRVPSPALMGGAGGGPQTSSNQAGFSSIRNIGLLLGWNVKFKLNEGPGVDRWEEGMIWCYDPIPGVVILQCPGNSKGCHTYRMIKVNQIKDLQVGSLLEPLPPNPSGLIPKILEPVRPIHVTAIAMREAQAVAADDAKRARIGHGVSRWAQEIFDALGKTLPVRWHQTSIIILDDVLLPGPFYRSEDVKVSGGNADRMSRVKQVLEGEWSRLLRTEEGKQMELEARNSASSSSSSSAATATAATTTTTTTPTPAS
ncbi:hypothetical protein PGT21_007788 [Puccinia graminis f. sp. tritici]|uniref:AD domain-containing protein n=1 Tax=Puccinia graminis f. sp. tritici TaxID=56615 RepID=A0A5B0QEK6_PUCGR|nr:hypothetical protein PGT21_007788 [Puccinia graminis f. sp. tritici]